MSCEDLRFIREVFMIILDKRKKNGQDVSVNLNQNKNVFKCFLVQNRHTYGYKITMKWRLLQY